MADLADLTAGTGMTAHPSALIVDDDANLRNTLADILRREKYIVREASDGPTALGMLADAPCDIVITDVRMPGMSGLDLLREIKKTAPRTIVIVMTAYDARDLARDAVNDGAYAYFSKPLDLLDIRMTLNQALEKSTMQREQVRMQEKITHLEEQIYERSFASIVGESPTIHAVIKAIEHILDNDITVLITGESGTGKEVVARAIHNNSSRRNKPFIAFNCAAIPETLLESELFGHERGAFTGATERRAGKFEAADNGTLFLDEIGDMPITLQAKILRVLQDGEITRIGDNKTIKVNVRLLAATNQDLKKLVEDGTFRSDLFYRLNVYPIMLPPLRARGSDLVLLAQHFIDRSNAKLNRNVRAFTPEALACMEAYSWPGNVRELENVVQRAVLLADTPVIGIEMLPHDIVAGAPASARKPVFGSDDTQQILPAVTSIYSAAAQSAPADRQDIDPFAAHRPSRPVTGDTEDSLPAVTGVYSASKRAPSAPIPDGIMTPELRTVIDAADLALPNKIELITQAVEKHLILEALTACNGHRQDTADRLGISRKTLHNKMKLYKISDDADAE